MSRLASLRGPSAPSSSGRSPPLSAAQQQAAFPAASLLSATLAPPPSPPAKTPLQPASVDPSPQHRKCRAVLVEVERTLRDWEQVVRLDGGKAGKQLVDARTELDNMAIAQRANTYPYAPSQLPSDWLARLAQAADDLRAALAKLDKRLTKLATLANAAEALLLESVRSRGIEFTSATPLWTTWSLEHFSASLSPLIAAVQHSYGLLGALARELLDPACSFEAGRAALEAWLREGAFERSWRFGLLAAAAGGLEGGRVGEDRSQVGERGGGGDGRMGLGRREWEECMSVEVKGWEDAFRIGGGAR